MTFLQNSNKTQKDFDFKLSYIISKNFKPFKKLDKIIQLKKITNHDG